MPFPGWPIGRAGRVVEAQRRERVRRDHVDALDDLDLLGVDHVRADALRRPREDGVEVGDPAVGDPGLRAGDTVAARPVVVIAATSEPASGSDSANAAIFSPRGHRRQVARRAARRRRTA